MYVKERKRDRNSNPNIQFSFSGLVTRNKLLFEQNLDVIMDEKKQEGILNILFITLFQ
jgi:hypothetical protein